MLFHLLHSLYCEDPNGLFEASCPLVVLAQAVDADLWLVPRARFLLPEINLVDSAPCTGQIDGTAGGAGLNHIANGNLLMLAIPIANDDVVEVNRAAVHANLDGSKGAVIVDLNGVVVRLTIYFGAAELDQLPGCA
jgi:hypothetical protein